MPWTNSKKIKSSKWNTTQRVSINGIPTAASWAQADGGYAPGYNVQISTDAKEKAIVAVSLSQSPADQTLLASAIDEIKETTGVNPKQLVVDAGFTTRDTVLTAEEKGIDLIGSFTETKPGRESTLRTWGIDEAFWPEKFLFDKEKNCGVCPEGKVLTVQTQSDRPRKNHLHLRMQALQKLPLQTVLLSEEPEGAHGIPYRERSSCRCLPGKDGD